jgi:hypothetical protein
MYISSDFFSSNIHTYEIRTYPSARHRVVIGVFLFCVSIRCIEYLTIARPEVRVLLYVSVCFDGCTFSFNHHNVCRRNKWHLLK